MRMREGRALRLAALLLLLLLLKLLLPGAPALLRTWAEEVLAPGAEETVTAWGRALAGQGERVAALQPEGRR